MHVVLCGVRRLECCERLERCPLRWGETENGHDQNILSQVSCTQ